MKITIVLVPINVLYSDSYKNKNRQEQKKKKKTTTTTTTTNQQHENSSNNNQNPPLICSRQTSIINFLVGVGGTLPVFDRHRCGCGFFPMVLENIYLLTKPL